MIRGRRAAFTLIEIMTVMIIIAVMLLAVLPALDNQVPAFRIRAAARTLASTIELAQSETVARREEFVLAYDLDRNTFELILPPGTGEEEEEQPEGEEFPGGEEPKEGRPANDIEHGPPPPDPNAEEEAVEDVIDYTDRDRLSEKQLPDDVVFALVVVGDKEHRSGKVYVPFSHLGNKGAHYVGVHLDPDGAGQDDNLEMWVKFNPMTRTIEYSDAQPQIRTLSGGGGE